MQTDQGRYGFARFLGDHGPDFVRAMPKGYIVELVQLLLNKNLLQFRKGKVTFRSVLATWFLRLLVPLIFGGATALCDVSGNSRAVCLLGLRELSRGPFAVLCDARWADFSCFM